jgi:hypothetical protein
MRDLRGEGFSDLEGGGAGGSWPRFFMTNIKQQNCVEPRL